MEDDRLKKTYLRRLPASTIASAAPASDPSAPSGSACSPAFGACSHTSLPRPPSAALVDIAARSGGGVDSLGRLRWPPMGPSSSDSDMAVDEYDVCLENGRWQMEDDRWSSNACPGGLRVRYLQRATRLSTNGPDLFTDLSIASTSLIGGNVVCRCNYRKRRRSKLGKLSGARVLSAGEC